MIATSTAAFRLFYAFAFVAGVLVGWNCYAYRLERRARARERAWRKAANGWGPDERPEP